MFENRMIGRTAVSRGVLSRGSFGKAATAGVRSCDLRRGRPAEGRSARPLVIRLRVAKSRERIIVNSIEQTRDAGHDAAFRLWRADFFASRRACSTAFRRAPRYVAAVRGLFVVLIGNCFLIGPDDRMRSVKSQST